MALPAIVRFITLPKVRKRLDLFPWKCWRESRVSIPERRVHPSPVRVLEISTLSRNAKERERVQLITQKAAPLRDSQVSESPQSYNLDFPEYRVPKTGIISYLPQTWVPYAELMRLDKPAGTYYLFFPCLFSTLMAASYTGASPMQTLSVSLLFFSGAFIMRGAGCSINDIWDRGLDPQVARTRQRPIARGALTASQALAFTGLQLLAGLGVLIQFPTPCLFYGVPSLLLVTIYPLAKRVTHYPQFVLGLTFSWGALMGFPALNVNLVTDSTALIGVSALYASCVSWTVLYDMIYAYMDIQDDARVGIKSIALKYKKDTKTVLSILALLQVGLLTAAGASLGLGPVFFFCSCGSAASTLGLMIFKVRLDSRESCWWWFRSGALLTGGGIASGLSLEYLFGIHNRQNQTETPGDYEEM